MRRRVGGGRHAKLLREQLGHLGGGLEAVLRVFRQEFLDNHRQSLRDGGVHLAERPRRLFGDFLEIVGVGVGTVLFLTQKTTKPSAAAVGVSPMAAGAPLGATVSGLVRIA